MADNAALRASAEETVMGMLYPDEAGRHDVVTSLSLLPTVYSGRGGAGFPADGAASFVPATHAQELLARQKAALKSLQVWKSRDRTKTLAVGIVLCLNIGTDPPDTTRVAPYAKEECWIDPSDLPTPQAALDEIGNALKAQYERLQSKAKFKLSLDPIFEDVQKLASSIRRNAKEDRVLFHYNGHGVPRPTTNGEVWVFNKNYTQYLPLSVMDLQSWLGSPAFYVFDCSHAGLLMPYFMPTPPAIQRNSSVSSDLNSANINTTHGSTPHAAPPDFSGATKGRDYFVLASCGAGQVLPTAPELPADVFTAALTTPIRTALQWALMRKGAALHPMYGLYRRLVERIPGRLSERRTPLGELNWIFTSITDTIAWTVLPRPLFLRLFRQDLLCASLFRNFLLADRILRHYNCVPESIPPLPPTHEHPLWSTWDAAVEQLLNALPSLFGYTQYDIRRMNALDLQPDLSHLDPEWNELMPPLKLKALHALANAAPSTATPTATVPSASTATSPPPPPPPATSGAAGGRGRRSSGISKKEPAIATQAVAALLPWQTNDNGVDALGLVVPPAASATAEQRVQMIRKRLYAMMPSTSVGPAVQTQALGMSAYCNSSFFDEQLAGFETWLRNAAYIPTKLHTRLGDVMLEFVQNGSVGFGGTLAYNLAANTAATYASLAAASVGGSDPLNLKSLAAAAAAANVPRTMFMATQQQQTDMLSKFPKNVVLPLTVPTSLSSHARGHAASKGPASAAVDSSIMASNMMLAAAAVGSVGGSSESRANAFAPVLRVLAPSQLPILLQVLLSQNQRLKALQLLAHFVDLGHEAVNLALIVGFHPYVCKLLQSASPELTPTLVFVWAKILALDRESQVGLVTQNAVPVFVEYLERMVDVHEQERMSARKMRELDKMRKKKPSADTQPAKPQDSTRSEPSASVPPDAAAPSPLAISEDQMTLALFVLCRIVEDYPDGQAAAAQAKLMPLLLRIVKDDQYGENRQWALHAAGLMLLGNEELRGKTILQKVRSAPNSVTLAAPVGMSAASGSGIALPAVEDTPAAHLGCDTVLRAILDEQPAVRATACWAISMYARDDAELNTVQVLTTLQSGAGQSSDPSGMSSPSKRRAPASELGILDTDLRVFRHSFEFFDARCRSIVRQDAVPLSFVNPTVAPSRPADIPDDTSVVSNPTVLTGSQPGGQPGRSSVVGKSAPHIPSGVTIGSTLFSPMEIGALAVREISADSKSTHAYLRACWGFAYALFASGGVLPNVFSTVVQADVDMQRAKKERQLAILKLFASRVKRSLLPLHIVQQMQALQAAASSTTTPASLLRPGSFGSFPLPSDVSASSPMRMPQSMSSPSSLMQTAPMSIPQLQVAGTTGADTGDPDERGDQRNDFTTDAPPADFLAEALAAAAAAEKMKVAGAYSNSEASINSSGAGELAGRGSSNDSLLHMQNIHTAYSVPSMSNRVTSSGNFTQSSDKEGDHPEGQYKEHNNADHATSSPRAAADARQAANEERRTARKAARQRLSELQSQFVSVFSGSSRSLREVSLGVLLACALSDANISVRTESIISLSRFAFHRTHEAALCLCVGALLTDFLSGGSRLLSMLRLTEDFGTVTAAASVTAAEEWPQHESTGTMPTPKAMPTKMPMDAPARQGFKLRLNFFNRLGNFMKESPKSNATGPETPLPNKPSSSAHHLPTGPRDASWLGLPSDVFSATLLPPVLDYFGVVYRNKVAKDDGTTWTPDSMDGSSESFQFEKCWMSCNKSGTPDPLVHLVSSKLGPRSLLYLSIASSLIAATVDGHEHCSGLARGITRRIMLRIAQTCMFHSSGKLPTAPAQAVPTASDLAQVESAAEARAIGMLLKAQEAFVAACVESWETSPGPSASELGLRTVLYETACTRFYQPLLPPHCNTEHTDPLSLMNLQRVTRHRLFQSALFEATALAVTAYDDVMVRYLIELSGAIWTSLQVPQKSSTIKQRREQAVAQKRALSKLQEELSRGWSAHQLFFPSPLPSTESTGSFANAMNFGAIDPSQTSSSNPTAFVRLPNGQLMPFVQQQLESKPVTEAGTAPLVLAPTGSIIPAFGAPQELYASTYMGSAAMASTVAPSGYYLRAGGMSQSMASDGTPMALPSHLQKQDRGYGTSPALLPVYVGAVTQASAARTAALSDATPQALAAESAATQATKTQLQQLPPRAVRNSATNATAIPPPEATGQAGPRSMSGSFYGSQRRPSRFQSEYDGGGGHDARMSAALLANDVSVLASSMGTMGDDDSLGLPLGDGQAEIGSYSADRVHAAPARQPSQLGTLSTIHESFRPDGEHDRGLGGTLALGFSLQVNTALPSPSLPPSSSQLFPGSTASVMGPQGPPPIAEEELDNQLCAVASVTPRISPALLARTRLGTVQYARAAARKLAQKCLLDTGSAATSCVLFHPWADFLVVADQADMISTWSYQDGKVLDKFRNTSGGSDTAYGSLWQPSWTGLLRQRMAPLVRETAPTAMTSPFAARIAGASGSLGRSGFNAKASDGWADARHARNPSLAPRAPVVTRGDNPSLSVEDVKPLPTVHRRVTSMTWINEHDACHLLTGSDDGLVRVWDGGALAASMTSADGPAKVSTRGRTATTAPEAAGGSPPPMVASFAALPELYSFPAPHSGDAAADAAAGLVLQWQPERAHLVAAGGRCPYARLWDMKTERCISQLPMNIFASSSTGQASMHVTCLTSSWPASDVLVAGTSNGTIQVLDTRLGGGFGAPSVLTLRDHKRWVVQVSQPRSASMYSLISGSIAGDVRFWDLRRPSSSDALQAHRGQMTSLAVHDYAPLVATGSRRQHVRILTNSGQDMGEIRYHDGFLGQRIGPVSTVVFHPNRLLMAIGALDSIVSVYHGVPVVE